MQDLVGKRIRLIKMVYDDPVEPGTTGKITRIDGIGLIHVQWQPKKGRGLCIDPDLDKFEVI